MCFQFGATTSTATSADTTGTTLKELLRKDVGQCGDGGESDEEGDDYSCQLIR